MLRPYQKKLVIHGISHRLATIVSPTGSGKSLVGTVIAAWRKQAGQRVLIATSQRSIENEFNRLKRVTLQGVRLVCGNYQQAREGGQARKAVLEYLSQTGAAAMLASHQALGGLDLAEVPGDLSHVCLLVDEAHHAGRTVTDFGELVAEFENRGAAIVLLTATDYRTDTDELSHSGYAAVRRTMGEQMRDGWAPSKVDFSLVPFCSSQTDDAAFHGDDEVQFGEEAVRRVAMKLVRQWKQDGRPKLIVRVPAIPSGAGETIRIVCEQFQAAGAEVVSAFGVDRTQLDESLNAEHAREYAESEVDVIVGCVRVGEAMDWPHCSAVYCLGIPRSTLLVVQLLGRAMRPKTEGCLAAWRDRSAIRFFIPTTQETDWSSLSKSQAWSALMVCCALELNSNASLYVAMAQQRRPSYQVPVVEQQVRGAISDELTRPKGLYLAAIAAQREAAERLGRLPTSRELAKILSSAAYGYDRQTIKDVLSMYFREPGDKADDCLLYTSPSPRD